MSDQNALARYMALINDIDRMRSQLMQGGNALATYASPVSAGRFSSEGRLNPYITRSGKTTPPFKRSGSSYLHMVCYCLTGCLRTSRIAAQICGRTRFRGYAQRLANECVHRSTHRRCNHIGAKRPSTRTS